ncbi:inactive ubiquitin thioesterase OTULINL isoform X2 [Balaenoptera musculus]|uniref:Inactive ubiquitin thioesterase OTULINL isoform X2 n=1 Tax=Balaenoptera musculus TaxID=9771 RepID=A0A8B8XB48_BALMU|nr:inactive ubiquitin thioesterase OTULINL isoform X2 [Balaenoptera musculus]
MAARRSPPRERERQRPRDPAAGNDQVHSWTLVTSQALDAAWRVAKGSVTLAVSFLVGTLCYFRRLHLYLGHWLKRWIGYLQRRFKRNLSVEAEVDILSYCAREWKGETPHAKLMRKAYKELFWQRHIKCVRQVRRDNYDALRSVLFQVFSQGLSFPSWMKEKDIAKLPEKLLFSQGCNWIQQYSFGPEKYTGSNVFGKLRKCVELLKTQWTEFSGIKDYHKRGSMCNALFSDAILECKLYEALKFIMLYQVTEAYEQMKTTNVIPSLFRLLFTRETSSDPLSFMMNHLNSVGDTCGLEQAAFPVISSRYSPERDVSPLVPCPPHRGRSSPAPCPLPGPCVGLSASTSSSHELQKNTRPPLVRDMMTACSSSPETDTRRIAALDSWLHLSLSRLRK